MNCTLNLACAVKSSTQPKTKYKFALGLALDRNGSVYIQILVVIDPALERG